MRDYLFRGKPKDKEQFNAFSITWAEYCFNGFVYGSLVKCNNRCYIAVTAQCSNKSIINNGITTMIEVIPETVGQYTGLTDKNGNKIFEGDMIKPFEDVIDKIVVEFCHGQFLLCLYGERGYMAEYGWEESGNYGCFEAEPLSSYGDDIEVIGNIHDNPELLKGGEE